jgi:hypothetical protein
LLFRLGGSLSRAYNQVFELGHPPYKYDLTTLADIFKEKLQDNTFRRSLCLQMLTFPAKAFTKRFLTRLKELLR